MGASMVLVTSLAVGFDVLSFILAQRLSARLPQVHAQRAGSLAIHHFALRDTVPVSFKLLLTSSAQQGLHPLGSTMHSLGCPSLHFSYIFLA